jgi:serine/threonine protein kinase
MACEQINAARASPQTDIWAFGLITYYVLTGRRYWRSANSAEAGVQSLFAEILTLPMEPPSQRLRDQGVEALLPVAFDGWFLKCIQRDPEQRFASAGEAMAELERALDGASVTALEAPRVGGPSASGTLQEGSLASVPGVVSERARSLSSPMSSGRWLWPAMGVGFAAVVVLGWLAFSEAFGAKASVTAVSTAVGSDPDTEAAARSVGHRGTPNPPTVRAAAPAGPDAGVGAFRPRKVAPRVRPIEEPADSETVDTAVDTAVGERSSLQVPFRIRRTQATPEPPATLAPQRPQATLPPKSDLTPARPPSKVIDPYATR